MAKKSTSKLKQSKTIKRLKQSASKAKVGTKKTKDVASEKLKDFGVQMSGRKEPEPETPDAPRITNDTVAEHREEVLEEARRYILPLHSRRRVVIISASILLGLIVAVLAATTLLLYQFQSTSALTYNITKIIPFPVARVDGVFVPYENYLFELRSSLHYYRNYGQEGVDIDSAEGEELLLSNKQRTLEKIQLDALARNIARDNDISVTQEEIDEAVQRFADRLGSTETEGQDSTLSGVLELIYDWDLSDLEKVVELQLIYQKVSPIIDEESTTTINQALGAIQSGELTFAEAAEEYSDDPAGEESGGSIGEISIDSTDWEKYIKDEIFALEEGATTAIVVSPRGQHIFKVDKIIDENTREVSQIFVAFGDIQGLLREQLEAVPSRAYIDPA